jgi:anti-sigma factor RsiW
VTAGPAHLGDLVSAYLDGELTPAERTWADGHLAGCPLCRAALAATASARTLVRGLAPVQPRLGFAEQVLRSERRRRPAALVAVAAAAVAVAAMAVTPPSGEATPPVGRFVEAHATATPGGDPVSNLGPPAALPVSFRP